MPPVHSAAEGEALWRRVLRAVGAAVDAGLCRHLSARWSLDWRARAVAAVTPDEVRLPGGVVVVLDDAERALWVCASGGGLGGCRSGRLGRAFGAPSPPLGAHALVWHCVAGSSPVRGKGGTKSALVLRQHGLS